MEIHKYVDLFADDVFALALIATKDFAGAKEVFVKTAAQADKLSDEASLFDALSIAFPIIREVDSNDEAVTLTGLTLSSKQEALLQTLLTKPQIVRLIVHLTYESDLTPEEIAKLTGAGERYVKQQLSELSESLIEALDKHYKSLCTKITAEDKLKEYVITAAERGKQREFEVKREAVPTHRWNKTQKLVVIIVAIIVGLVVFIVMPIIEMYREMVEKQGNESYENLATDKIFSYTVEAENNLE